MNRRTRDQAAQQTRRDRQPARRPWPVLTDRTAIDRARTTARLLLDACHSPDPAAAAQAITDAVRSHGETWLTPIRDTTPDSGRLTEQQAAEIVGKRGVTVRAWSNRGVLINGTRHYLPRYPDGYDESELLAFDAAMRGDHPTTGDTA